MTFEHDAVIASLASRASDQVKAGLKELHAGNLLGCEVFLNAACATLSSLQALLDGTRPPLRKLAVVQKPRDEDETLPQWMNRKAGEPDGAA